MNTTTYEGKNMFPENDKPCLSIGAFKHKKSFVITTIESLEKYAVSTSALIEIIPRISEYLSLKTKGSDLSHSELIKSLIIGDFSKIPQVPEKLLKSFHLLLKDDDFVIKFLTSEVVDKQMDEKTEEALVKATSLRIKSEHNKFSDFMNNKQAQESAVSMFSQDGKYKIDEVISFIRNNAHDYPSPNFELAFAELLEFITSKEHNPHYYAELKCTIEDEFPYVYRLCRDADISESGILDMIMYYMINSSAMPPFRDTYK